MLKSQNNKILMDEGDWGLSLPFKLTGDNILSTDVIEFKIKKDAYDEKTIIKKQFSNLSQENETFVFVLDFTKEESDKLPANKYRYGLKQYRDGELLNTIIKDESFEVEKGV